MTKVNSKKEKKVAIPRKNLLEAADCLIKTMKKPEEFLSFLTTSLSWMEHFNGSKREKEEKCQDTFFIRLFISEVLIPWMKGGENFRYKMASGLYEVGDYFNSVDYSKYIASMVVGLGTEMNLFVGVYYIESSFLFIQVLNNIGFYLQEDRDEEQILSEKTKMKTAA